MSQRRTLPAGHNHTTARFAREAAQPLRYITIERTSMAGWSATIVIYALLALAFAAVCLLLPGCQLNEAALERAMQADAQEALQELAEAQRIERIAALVDASARGQ